MFMQRIVVAL